MKKITPLIIVALLFALTEACYSDNKEDLYENYQTDDCDTLNTKFMANILPILTENCATSGCHLGVGAQSGLDLSTYADVEIIAKDGRLEGRITGSGGAIMPPVGAMSDCNIDRILKWVANGSQNN